MMLRSRNVNNVNQGNAANGKPEAKRVAKKGLSDAGRVVGEPKPKRQAFADISHAVANFLIDSSKKIEKNVRRSSSRLGEKKQQAKNIKPIPEPELAPMETETSHNDDSVIVLEDPCPSYDFDAESSNDPMSVHDFAADIFKYYRSREKAFKVVDYIEEQPHITRDNRAALVDWMVEIQETFELNHETLYLAVKLVDLYLSSVVVKLEQMQLIACTAFFIASKFDERSPPLIDDFIYISDDSFDRDQLIHMEMEMVRVVGFDLGCPLSYRFVRRYARVCKQDMATLTLARYILETSLMFYELTGVSESRLAAAAFYLAIRMKDSTATWSPVLVKYSGYRIEEIEPLMWQLNHMLYVRSGTAMNKLTRVFSKYSHEVFFRSASVPTLADKFSIDEPVKAPAGQGFKR